MPLPRAVQLRHPNVLQFKDSVEVEAAEKGGPVTLFLVTEPVQPLSTLLADLQLGGAQRCGPLPAPVVSCALTQGLVQGRVHSHGPQPSGAGGVVPQCRLQDGEPRPFPQGCQAHRP